jgi:peptidyl-tRNA hydrolase, PTH1 family
MWLVVGLGNPGERYRRTRHNLGYMVVDELAGRHAAGRPREEGEALVLQARVAGQDALLVKPLTFMNRSGVAVERLLQDHGGVPGDLVVVLDDLAIPLGEIRVRERGSHGGHNGLRSLIDVLGTEEMARVRVGIGQAEPLEDLAGYVLSDFPEEDVLVVHEAVGWAADAVACLIAEGATEAMNRFNGPRKA